MDLLRPNEYQPMDRANHYEAAVEAYLQWHRPGYVAVAGARPAPWRGRRYLLRAVLATEYRRHLRVRSPRWGTVTVPRAVFRRLVRPFRYFTRGAPISVPPTPSFAAPACAAACGR